MLSGPLFFLFSLQTDRLNYITYRFAANVSAGRGLVYWSPDPAITTYPLVPLLLAALGENRVFSATLLCAVATALGAWCLAQLTGNRWVVGLIYVPLALLNPSPVMLVMLALALGAVYMAMLRRWFLAGILVGLAILSHPLAIILALLLILYALRDPGALRHYLPPAVLIPALGMIILIFSLRVHDGINIASPVKGIIIFFLPFVALVGLARNWKVLTEQPQIAILAAWSALCAVLTIINGHWLSLAVIPGVIALAVTASTRLLRIIGLVAAIMDISIIFMVLTTGDQFVTYPAPEVIRQQIAENTGAEDVVATNDIEVNYYLDRPVIDLSGTVQSFKLDKDFFVKYAPAALVLRDYPQVSWNGFESTYTSIFPPGAEAIYRRAVNFSPLDEHPVDIVYGANLRREDLRLKGIAIANTIHPGDLVRVRLDWELAYAPSFDTEIRLNLLDPYGNSIGGFADKLTPEQWYAGRISTYHVFGLIANPPVGPLSVNVGFRIRDGNLGDHVAVQITLAK